MSPNSHHAAGHMDPMGHYTLKDSDCPPLPPCPACGGLECLCRPRFFAGQLLTEEDLNRLERYVVEKNKLHNRYLIGWGVACGLEVACNPCDGYVTVKAGYAISPCGEDIVVCNDASVDVCALIAVCQDKRQWECDPPWAASPDGCQEAEEQWQLAICYDEKPSRGITALRGSSGPACCSKCSCGGSSACGCGCHEAPKSNGCRTYRPPVPNPPPQCEPTLTCEGYRFVVYKAPLRRRDEERPSRGALLDRAIECWKHLQECREDPPVGDLNAAHVWCCRIRDCLRDFLLTHPIHDCRLLSRLDDFCPTPGPNTTANAYVNEVLTRLQQVEALILQSCLCSALLPPCPDPAQTNCVPLAQLTVRRRNCEILRICNFEGRKFLVTMPNLGYWLSPWGFGSVVREWARQLCCVPPRQP